MCWRSTAMQHCSINHTGHGAKVARVWLPDRESNVLAVAAIVGTRQSSPKCAVYETEREPYDNGHSHKPRRHASRS
eukprot:m.99640 g.99640  ORF g.99640 m.99640 type:complete len:76 (-) comp15348_c0_seq3:532-759(-)